jgi:hypothetical protein
MVKIGGHLNVFDELVMQGNGTIELTAENLK